MSENQVSMWYTFNERPLCGLVKHRSGKKSTTAKHKACDIRRVA